MKENLVSVIVPVYGVLDYIEDCVDSIIKQTYHNIEIILIDDGSPDKCGEICDAYASKDTRVRSIHQTNAGAANAKNAGLDAAKGDYIAFVDSDDWVDQKWLETLLEKSQNSCADIVECSLTIEYVNYSTHSNDRNTFTEGIYETEDYLRQYPHFWTNALFANKLFKSDLLRDVRFRTERRCIDDEFFTYKAVTGANCVYRIPDELYHYRQRRSSVTQKKSTLYQRTIDDLDILAERYQWMKKHYPNIAMDYLRHDVDTLLYFAGALLYNEQAIALFRKTAKFYFREVLHSYPGKLTLYYALKSLMYPQKKFKTDLPDLESTTDIDKYFK